MKLADALVYLPCLILIVFALTVIVMYLTGWIVHVEIIPPVHEIRIIHA